MTPERKQEIINSLKLDHYQDDREIKELLDHIDEQEKKIEALASVITVSCYMNTGAIKRMREILK